MYILVFGFSIIILSKMVIEINTGGGGGDSNFVRCAVLRSNYGLWIWAARWTEPRWIFTQEKIWIDLASSGRRNRCHKFSNFGFHLNYLGIWPLLQWHFLCKLQWKLTFQNWHRRFLHHQYLKSLQIFSCAKIHLGSVQRATQIDNPLSDLKTAHLTNCYPPLTHLSR